VIVENRAGAGGQIAAQALKAAPADGTTYFLTHDHTVSILPLVVKNPGFDPAKDFVAGGRLCHLCERAGRLGRHACEVDDRVRRLGQAARKTARARWACLRRPPCLNFSSN
jgi:hypothetical protein